jgi:DNA-binding NtrC family response regulator
MLKKEHRMPPQSIILIVEDDAAVTAALYEVLSFHGFRIITADSVEAAERALQCLGAAQVHLVISDIHLTRNPDACEGYALYQRWTYSHPGLPFILISAFPSSRDLPAIHAQAVRFLEKPFAIQALLQCVEEAMGGPSSATTNVNSPQPCGSDSQRSNPDCLPPPSSCLAQIAPPYHS